MAHLQLPSLESPVRIKQEDDDNNNLLPPTINWDALSDVEHGYSTHASSGSQSNCGCHNGGKPQSPLRSWYIPHLKDPTLAGKKKFAKKNIKCYQCPACGKMGIDPNHIDELKKHTRQCASFPMQYKGICLCALSVLSSCYIPVIHSSLVFT